MRAIELGRGIAAAYAGKLLADIGVDVVLAEPTSGHPLRELAPHPRAGADRGGALFQYLGSGKQSTIVDPATKSGREALVELVSTTDLVIEDLGPGLLESYGITRAALAARRSHSALIRISPFGLSGPYRDREASSLVLQAAGGWVARIGTPESRPYYVGCRIEEYVAGAYAAAAALTASAQAKLSDQVIEVDVSIFDCIAGTIPYPMLQKITFDRLGFPVPQRYQPIPGILPCADGHVGVSALTGQHWADVCAILEVTELAQKMREVTLRGAEWREFLAKAEPWLASRNAAEIVELFQVMRVPAVPIGNGANLPSIEPFASRDFYVRQPESGSLVPRSPLRFHGADGAVPRAAPLLGEQTLRTSTTAARAASTSSWVGGREGLPFSGLKVLDLTTFWAGPYFTMYLASFGADVIKIESPKRPDGFRFVAAFPQLGDRWWEQSGVFHATNLGKRDLTLDLDDPRGKALALRLAAEADVVAENFSPRVIEHFGLDYDAIRAVNPRAIMVRMPGFGLTGPCRDWVGWALSFEQMAGCAEITGEENGRRFAPGGFADPVVGMHAAVALQAALAERETTRVGQLIEVAQVEAVAAMTAEQVIRHSLTGERVTRQGNRSPDAAPQGIYRTEGNDEWIAITVRDADDWQRFCAALALRDFLRDATLVELAARRQRHDEIDRAIEAWTSSRPPNVAERALVAAGVPAARLLKTEAFYTDPHLAARAHFRTLDHAVCGPLAYPSWPLRFSSGPEEPYAAGAPTLGQHNEEILRTVLGLSDAEIVELRAARVIGETMS
jgi:crotonobetainyl-CoA:carnitine CoA-transferase CaiB-like acyl-CoA transferase